MTNRMREAIDAVFSAVMAKDLDRLMACFADDAVFVDPHYPTPRMVGKAAIRDGMTWSFGSIKKFGFVIEKFYLSEDGNSGAMEVATAHVAMGGMKVEFPQAFFFDMKDGKVTRLQAYEPYGPHGVASLVLGLERLRRRVLFT